MEGRLLFAFAAFIASFARFAYCQLRPTDAEIVKTLLANYTKEDPPSAVSGKVVEVKIGVYITELALDKDAQVMKATYYLRQAWTDTRLKVPQQTEKRKVRVADPRQFWLPDTFFRNDLKSEYHDITIGNQFTRIDISSGDVWYVQKLSSVFACPMNLVRYPVDTVTCSITVESFGYTMDKMYYSWLSSPIDHDGTVGQHTRVTDHLTYECSQNYTTGSYTCLEARIQFDHASLGNVIVQVYFPSVMLVILSCLSFWIRPSLRCLICLVSVLLTLASAMTQSVRVPTMPRVPYATTLDAWTVFVVIFVIAVLVEYIVVDKVMSVSTDENYQLRNVDKICAIVFPVVFAVFFFSYIIACAAS